MEQQPKTNKKWIIPVSIVAVVIALVLGVLGLVMHGNNNQSPSVDQPPVSNESEALAALRAQLLDPSVKEVTINEQIVTEQPLEVAGEKKLTGTGTIRYADTVSTESALIVLQEGAELSLDGVIVDANNCGNGIYVPEGTTFVLRSGTVQFANAWNVYNDGTFEMLDGIITGAQEQNVITAAKTTIDGGEIAAGGQNNIQVISGTTEILGGNILNAGTSGIYVAEKAKLQMNGELVRVRESAGYGVEVHGEFILDYGNILKNGTDNVYVGQTGKMVMNDGYIATAVTCGIKCRGDLEIHGGIIEYNGTDGVDTAKTCVVDGGTIAFNTRRGFTNATGGTLTIEGDKVSINANKFGLYNEVGSVATLRDVTIRNSGTNNIRNFGELNLYNYVSKDSTSVHLSTLSGSKVHMENVLLDTNSKSHGIYNYAGTITFKDLTITSPAARGIRNIGGSVVGENYEVNGTYTTGLTNEDVEDKTGYMEIKNIKLSGTFDYGIYNFAGTTKLRNVTVGVTNKNSLKVEAGDVTITNATFNGCNAIPGQPDVAVYDAYFTGGRVTLNSVTLKDSYSSLVRNRSAQVTMNDCVLTGSGAAALNNSALADSGAYGHVVCNNVTFVDNKSANVKNSCQGSITLNGCYMGLTTTTNVAAEDGTIILNNSVVDGTAADGEKVGFVVFEKATGIMKGNSTVRNTYGKGVSVLGTFYMYGGTVTNCSSRNGAGLNNEGTFYVYGGTVKGNTALEGNGGAIRNKGKMYIENLLVENNTAYSTGGAVSNGGEMTIKDCVIRNNKTVGDDINGGAIYAAEGTLTVENTVIEGNVTSRHGGAFAIKDTATVILNEGVEIKNNTATVGSGGAVINYGKLIMNGGIITGNTAGKHGGGVASSAPGVFQFNGGTIEGNTAGGNGGGVYHGGGSFTMAGGTIADNNAATLGGSIAIGSETAITLQAGSVSSGKAATVPGIYIAGDTEVTIGAEAKLEETVHLVSSPITLTGILQNALTAEYEGYYPGQQILKNSADSEDFIAASVAAVTLVDCEYALNDLGYLASDAEMGFVAKIGDVKYTALETAFAEVQGGQTIELLADCTVSAKIDTKGISGTVTLVGNGFTVTHGAFDGHMITVRDGVTLVLGKEDGSDTLILDGGNLTGQTEARLLGVAGGGKAIINKGTTLCNSYSSKHGGAVLLDSGELILNGGTITGNTAGGVGGAVFAQGSAKMTIVSGTVSHNKTTANHGGALYFKGTSALTMDGGSVENNESTTKACGAIFLEGGSFTMNDGTITGNKAKTVSGAIHIKSGGSFTMNGGTITGNTAEGVGGAINAEKGSITLAGGTITGNTGATTNGIHVANGVTVSMGGNLVVEDIYMAGDGAVETTALATTADVNISLAVYTDGRAVLTGAADVLADAANKVTVTDDNWILGTDGCLEEAPVVEYAAKIQGGESYLDLAAAMEAAQDGDTIILLNNVAPTATINVTKKLTIWGDGYTITHGDFSGNLFTVREGGQLTFSKEDGTDTLTLDGGNLTSQTEARLLGVAAGGKVIVNKGVTLCNSYSSKHGGAILLDSGELILNGGSITGNTANGAGGAVFAQGSAKMTIVSGTVSNNKTLTNHGAALYFKGTSTLIMDDGAVTNNDSTTKAGGAVFLEGSSFIMNGGTISGNKAKTVSGAIHIKSGGSFTMNGGSITGNTAGGIGGAINAEKGSIALAGGSITGNTGATTNGIHVASGVTLSVGGNVTVDDIYLAAAPTVTVTKELPDTASVGITIADYSGYTTTPVALYSGTDSGIVASAAKRTALTDANYVVETSGYITTADNATMAAKIGTTYYADLPSAIAAAQDNDVISLLCDVTVEAAIEISKPITILGNGNTITHGEYAGNMFTVSSELILGKEDGSDILTVDGAMLSTLKNARGFIVSADGTMTIYEGVTLQNVGANGNAGCILIQGGTVNLKGGVITGNTAGGTGAAIFMEKASTLIMDDGEISGNASAGNGGAIYIKGGSSFTMNDGKIVGNESTGKHGGAIFLETASDSFVMNNGELSGNTAKGHGGAVCVSKGIFTMNDGKITGNTAKSNSGAVHVADAGALLVQGGTIESNTATGVGGNVAVAKGSFLTLSGGTVGAGTADGNGDSIYIAASSCTVKMSGGAAVTGEFFLDGGAVITINGALTAEQAAQITLPDYAADTAVLQAEGVALAEQVGKFTVANSDWQISDEGKLEAVSA